MFTRVSERQMGLPHADPEGTVLENSLATQGRQEADKPASPLRLLSG